MFGKKRRRMGRAKKRKLCKKSSCRVKNGSRLAVIYAFLCLGRLCFCCRSVPFSVNVCIYLELVLLAPLKT